jgi:hypothetical protein
MDRGPTQPAGVAASGEGFVGVGYCGPARSTADMRRAIEQGMKPAVVAVDTDVLVRLLTNDIAAQAARTATVFRAGSVFVPKTVLVETEQLLCCACGWPAVTIARAFLGPPVFHWMMWYQILYSSQQFAPVAKELFPERRPHIRHIARAKIQNRIGANPIAHHGAGRQQR